MIIRSARETDLDSLLNLSALLPPGMTSMPFDKHTWEKKLELVRESLRGESRRNTESVYLLVMEEQKTEKIVGTAGIVSGVGLTRPFYNYKLSKESKYSELLDLRVTSNLLNLVNDFTGETELISLFLLPDFRKKNAGQFLSRCRYVFMSDFPERFSDIVFAEIRGWLDESENSPFWQHLGKKFFNLPFARADFISAVNGSQFISDLMPRFPVYKELLHEEAVAVIGKPHDDAVPARKLLEKEGFAYHGMIDIFDAGPVMECERVNINSIKNCSTAKITGLLDEHSEVEQLPLYIVSNRRLDNYRLVLSPVKEFGGNEVAVSSEAVAALGVEPGSEVQLLKIR
ncbi:MAG: arginine N-succinyltransferase [Proteobacteria bacterium]|nr:arginine N-succinyltransferase [Pseudomonadota bacterium]